MNVLVNAGLFYKLHQAQHEIGINSKLVTSGRDDFSDPSIRSLGKLNSGRIKFALLNRIGNIPVQLYSKRKPWIWAPRKIQILLRMTKLMCI